MAWLKNLPVWLLVLTLWPGVAAAQCPGADFRAMTYNIRLDTPADGPNRWELRRDLLIAQVRLLRPQVLGLQEVLPGQRADIAAALPGYAVLGGGRDDGRDVGEGSPLLIDLARFRVVSSGMIWLSTTPDRPSRDWDAAYPRVATWAHLVETGSGRRLLAINTHWDHVGIQARANSGALLADWIVRHAGRGEAVLLLGDFNASLEEVSFQPLLGAAPHLREAGSAAREPATGGPATFNGWHVLPEPTQAIDHLFVSASLMVQRHQVVAQHFGGRLASDHFPVVADLAFAASRACGPRK